MFQGLSGAILEALILMLGAALLAGLIVYLLMRARVQALIEKLRQQAQPRTAADTSDDQLRTLRAQAESLAAQIRSLQDQLADKDRLLADCGRRRQELENEAEALRKQLAASQDTLEQVKEEAEDELEKARQREAEILKRIQERAKDIDFDRIGTASPDDKDDLLIIKGIGPFIEKKLHSIGIYTFRQIANFTPEDEEKVNEVIEFFPGRIRREKWVEQAAALDREKREKQG